MLVRMKEFATSCDFSDRGKIVDVALPPKDSCQSAIYYSANGILWYVYFDDYIVLDVLVANSFNTGKLQEIEI